MTKYVIVRFFEFSRDIEGAQLPQAVISVYGEVNTCHGSAFVYSNQKHARRKLFRIWVWNK